MGGHVLCGLGGDLIALPPPPPLCRVRACDTLIYFRIQSPDEEAKKVSRLFTSFLTTTTYLHSSVLPFSQRREMEVGAFVPYAPATLVTLQKRRFLIVGSSNRALSTE